jgi:DNA-binding transcriptional ArsR family regulator
MKGLTGNPLDAMFTHPDTHELSLVTILHALSDPVRLIVVKSLSAHGELTCGAIQVPVAKSTMSHHLRVLREAGVTRVREDGTMKHISLRREDLERRFPGVLDSVLRSCDDADLYARAENAETDAEPCNKQV